MLCDAVWCVASGLTACVGARVVGGVGYTGCQHAGWLLRYRHKGPDLALGLLLQQQYVRHGLPQHDGQPPTQSLLAVFGVRARMLLLRPLLVLHYQNPAKTPY